MRENLKLYNILKTGFKFYILDPFEHILYTTESKNYKQQDNDHIDIQINSNMSIDSIKLNINDLGYDVAYYKQYVICASLESTLNYNFDAIIDY